MASREHYVQIRGIAPLLRKLNRGHLYGRKLGEIVPAATRLGHREARHRAPVGRGVLRGSVRMTVDSESPPTFGKVTVDADRRGARYPWMLEASKKPRYRHRSGPRRGRLTRGWFTAARRVARAYVRKEVGSLRGQVKRLWGAR